MKFTTTALPPGSRSAGASASARLHFNLLVSVAVGAALLMTGCKAGNKGGGWGAEQDTSTVTSAAPNAAGGIVIGEFGSLTGDTASFGTSTDQGIELAKDTVNAAGGVLGQQISVVVKDDASKAEQASTVVEALVQQKVTAILGEVASSRSLQGAPVCQAQHIPMISPASTNPRVTQVGDYIFRVCFIDSFQGKAIAEVGANDLHAKKAAVLYDSGQDYSKGLKGYIEQEFTRLGGAIAVERSYSGDSKDYSAQLTAIKAADPDVLFVPGYYTEVAQIASQARALGITIPLVGGDGWDSPELTNIASGALNNCYFTDHFSSDEKNPVVQAFVKKYSAEYKVAPDAMAALGYDAAGVLFDAIKRAGSTDGPAVRKAISQTKNFPGVTGMITIGPDRNAVKPIVVIKIVDNKPTFFKRVSS